MTSRIPIIFSFGLLVLLGIIFPGFSQPTGYWNSFRDLEPVVVSGNLIIGLTGVPINEIYVYIFDARERSWYPIPFQIDEKDNTNNYWLPAPNQIFDGNDELVFMAKDVGEQAPDGSFWIDDPDSKQYERVEIAVMDTLSNQVGYVYVYRSPNSLPLSPVTYMNYHPAVSNQQGADSVLATSYVENHTQGGIPTDWKLLDGTGVDILDRQKIRIALNYGIIITVDETISESSFDTLKVKVGPVRVIREVFWHIDLFPGLISPKDLNFPFLYYPYSIESGGISGTIKPSDHVDMLRQSFDLNPNANGMKFYNPYNLAGVTIDGSGGSEGVNTKIDDAPAVNWWLITGNQGSYSLVFRIEPIGNKRTLYYYDEKKTDNSDTGDLMSWGDTGIKIEGKDIAGNISVSYRIYFLGPNKPASLGTTLANNFVSPLKIQFQANSYVPVELAYFRAVQAEGKVRLEWQTQSESNNYGFEVQRSSDERATWEVLGLVKGHGTSTAVHSYAYEDLLLNVGTYYYRLKQIDFDGKFEFSEAVRMDVAAPKEFVLHQNYPNPFNPETVIRYHIPMLDQPRVSVDLRIYNMMGREVKVLVQEDQRPGFYSVRWDGRDNSGMMVAPGTYFYRLKADRFVRTVKMVLMK